MYLVSKEVEFDAAHRVPDHASKCFNLHGHRYKVRATVEATMLQEQGTAKGMVVDFGDLKAGLNRFAHVVFDHKCVLYAEDPLMAHMAGTPGVVAVAWIPTAENFARHIFDSLKLYVPWGSLLEVAVFETPTSVAYYKRED